MNNNRIKSKEEPTNKQIVKMPYEDSFIELPIGENAVFYPILQLQFSINLDFIL